MNLSECLKLFSLDNSYSKEDIKRSYKRLSKKHHPDLGGDKEKFVKINDARIILEENLKKEEDCPLCMGTKVSLSLCSFCTGEGSIIKISKINGIPRRGKIDCLMCKSTGKIMRSCILCSKDSSLTKSDVERYVKKFNL